MRAARYALVLAACLPVTACGDDAKSEWKDVGRELDEALKETGRDLERAGREAGREIEEGARELEREIEGSGD